MEKLEARLMVIDNKNEKDLDEAEAILEGYLHQITRLENYILRKRIEVAQNKSNVQSALNWIVDCLHKIDFPW